MWRNSFGSNRNVTARCRQVNPLNRKSGGSFQGLGFGSFSFYAKPGAVRVRIDPMGEPNLSSKSKAWTGDRILIGFAFWRGSSWPLFKGGTSDVFAHAIPTATPIQIAAQIEGAGEGRTLIPHFRHRQRRERVAIEVQPIDLQIK
jgi:hypothetical protein